MKCCSAKDFCQLLCVLKGLFACENDHGLPNEVNLWTEVGNIIIFTILFKNSNIIRACCRTLSSRLGDNIA